MGQAAARMVARSRNWAGLEQDLRELEDGMPAALYRWVEELMSSCCSSSGHGPRAPSTRWRGWERKPTPRWWSGSSATMSDPGQAM